MSREIDSRSKKFESLVIGSRKLGDNDRIVLFLCRGYGRLDAVARGSRKPNSRFRGALEPFTALDAAFYRRHGSELWTLTEAEIGTKPPHPEDWRSALVLQSAAELIYHAAPFETMESESYDLALAFLAAMKLTRSPLAPLFAYVVAWSERAGYGRPKGNAFAEKFFSRVLSDPAQSWSRYRLSPETEKELLKRCRAHVERCTEKEWKGIKMLASQQ